MASLAVRRCSHALSHTRLHISAFAPARTGMMSASTWATSGASTSTQPASPSSSTTHQKPPIPVVVPTDNTPLSADAASPQTAARPPPAPRPQRAKPTLRSKKAALTITPTALDRLKTLSKSPTPQLLRIGVRNKGCAGLSYHLEYVDKAAKFDEVVEQDGVQVVIDSKALFSIIGSEMDWKEEALSSKFVFANPNITDACGCGESFTVGS
ncbi:hypothetical protein PENSPDRAFT_647749 [Peniophora sp. CONT]|nr:hypothetical protein PENSPDRAFT_647749 [Peniophora sp. CONT]